jgi:PIN domain
VAFTALYDACVLYPAPIRDVLMHLALTDLFHARWTNMIHEEWIRAVLANRPDLTRPQLERTRDLMNAHARDALIHDFEDLIPSLSLPDPNDRHVLAAAIRGRVDVIVTYNTKDFPDKSVATYAIVAQHPDQFLTHVLDLAPGTVLAALQRLRQSLKRPPVAISDYLVRLEGLELPTFVAKLREFEPLL